MGSFRTHSAQGRGWRQGLTAALLLGLAMPAAGAVVAPYVLLVATDTAQRLVPWQTCQSWPPEQRQGAMPCGLRLHVDVSPEPRILPFRPYEIDRSLPPDDQAALASVAEGLRICPTGRILYAYLRRSFGPLSGTMRSLTLTSVPLGENGDLAVTSGTPPHYVITLNRDLLYRAGPRAFVAKLGHEIVHVHDYAAGVRRSVSMEVSAHAADAAIAYEANMITTGQPLGAYTTLISLSDVYHDAYIPFRAQPTVEAYNGYWQQLMIYVIEGRPYAQLYRDDLGVTIWNSPPGPVSAQTYVPYDPAFGWPEDGG
jgi:hypothetical protein